MDDRDAGSEAEGAAAPASSPRLRRWLPLLALGAVTLAALVGGAHSVLSFDALVVHAGRLQAWVAERPVAAASCYAAAYVAIVALSVPGALLATLTGGFLFGAALGGALTAVAATAGATIVFLIARSAVGGALARRADSAAARLAKGFREDAFGFLLALRLAPAFPFFVVNLAAAVLGVPLRTFVATTALGILPGTFAFSAVGAGLGGLVAEEGRRRADCLAGGGRDCAAKLDPASLVSGPILLALSGLAAAALVPVAVRRWRAGSRPSA